MHSLKYYLATAILIFTVSSFAQTKPMWPGAEYSADIPTVESVLGYAIGERITSHADSLKYFEALVAAAPKRITLVEYGKTWQGRSLVYAVLGSGETLANLPDFQANMQRLSDPRLTNKAAAQALIKALPASVWLGYPITAIRVAQLDDADLARYDVLILPSGDYPDNKDMISSIRSWVKAGGVLLTLGDATEFAASKDTGLLALKLELALKQDGDGKDEKDKNGKDKNDSTSREDDAVAAKQINAKEDFFKAIESHKGSPDSVPGILAKIDIDTEHWLAAGVSSKVYGLVRGDTIFQPIKLADGINVASFSAKDTLLASGYIWEENLAQMPFKPFMVQQPLGKGMVIAFTQDIAVRAYQDGLNILLANSIFLAPAHTDKLH
jgi:hypothetical protein